jgi:hypothetical protein
MREATPEEVADTLAHSLLFEGRKRKHDADGFMARIVADRLVEHLRLSNYVIMKKAPAPQAPPFVWSPDQKKPP